MAPSDNLESTLGNSGIAHKGTKFSLWARKRNVNTTRESIDVSKDGDSKTFVVVESSW